MLVPVSPFTFTSQTEIQMSEARRRREAVFKELHALVNEFDAVANDASWNVDDQLSNLLVRLNGEIRRARKAQHSVLAQVCQEATCNG